MKSKTTLFVLASLLGTGVLAKAEDAPKGPPPHKIPAEVIKEFDKDGDGKLNEDERAAAKAAHEKKMLEKFDTDKDGKLSDDEKAAARAAHEKEVIAKFDKDGDGKLNEEEKKAAHEAGAFGPGPGGPGGRGPGGPGGKRGGKGPGGPPPAGN